MMLRTLTAGRIALIAVLCSFLSLPAFAAPPRELVDELQGIVDEAYGSDDSEARAWALRAKTLLGSRTARTPLTENRENADLLVRVFSGVGLLEIGRREGADTLAQEITGAGAASRQRILSRYVRHLSERDQIRVIEAALEGAETDALRDVVNFIARYGEGDVFGLLGEAASASGDAQQVYLDAIGTSERSEAIDIASTLASSRDAETRLLAANMAASLGGEGGRGLLVGLLGDSDGRVASAAALALAPQGVAEAYDYLLEVARSGEPADRAAALRALRDGQPQLLSFESLLAMLDSAPDPAVQRAIIEAMGATGSDEAYTMLSQRLEGTVYEERLDAIAGLGYTRRASAVDPLGEVLLGGGGDELRLLAAEALGHLHLEAAAAPLLDGMQRERGGAVEVAIITALATAPAEDALWPLAFQLSNSDDDVVRAALNTLGTLGARSVSSQVENAATSHQDPAVRWTATVVLFSLDPEVGAIRLNQALDRPPEGFITDIDNLPEGPRVEAYTRLARHNNPDIRMMAATRIMRLEDGGIDVWRGLTEAAVPSDMRQLAVAEVTARRDVADLELIQSLADTSHPTMRYQATEALVELAAPESEEYLRAMLDSTEIERRVMAVYGLWKMAN